MTATDELYYTLLDITRLENQKQHLRRWEEKAEDDKNVIVDISFFELKDSKYLEHGRYHNNEGVLDREGFTDTGLHLGTIEQLLEITQGRIDVAKLKAACMLDAVKKELGHA